LIHKVFHQTHTWLIKDSPFSRIMTVITRLIFSNVMRRTRKRMVTWLNLSRIAKSCKLINRQKNCVCTTPWNLRWSVKFWTNFLQHRSGPWFRTCFFYRCCAFFLTVQECLTTGIPAISIVNSFVCAVRNSEFYQNRFVIGASVWCVVHGAWLLDIAGQAQRARCVRWSLSDTHTLWV